MYQLVNSELLEAVLIVLYPLHSDCGMGCSELDPNMLLVCTRNIGHDGPHVAHGSTNALGQHRPLSMWDNKETT